MYSQTNCGVGVSIPTGLTASMHVCRCCLGLCGLAAFTRGNLKMAYPPVDAVVTWPPGCRRWGGKQSIISHATSQQSRSLISSWIIWPFTRCIDWGIPSQWIAGWLLNFDLPAKCICHSRRPSALGSWPPRMLSRMLKGTEICHKAVWFSRHSDKMQSVS